MIEIIALIIFSQIITSKARQKGYFNTGRFVVMYLGFWFIFQLIGYTIGLHLSSEILIQYALALFFAFIGAFISLKIVDSLNGKEIKTGFDPAASIELPFEINILKQNIISITAVIIITGLLAFKISHYAVVILILVFVFTNLKIYNIVFERNNVTIKSLLFTKTAILKNQIVRMILNNKNIIEIHWKKSSRHSTKIIKFSASDFMKQNIPVENIKHFLDNTYIQS